MASKTVEALLSQAVGDQLALSDSLSQAASVLVGLAGVAVTLGATIPFAGSHGRSSTPRPRPDLGPQPRLDRGPGPDTPYRHPGRRPSAQYRARASQASCHRGHRWVAGPGIVLLKAKPKTPAVQNDYGLDAHTQEQGFNSWEELVSAIQDGATVKDLVGRTGGLTKPAGAAGPPSTDPLLKLAKSFPCACI